MKAIVTLLAMSAFFAGSVLNERAVINGWNFPDGGAADLSLAVLLLIAALHADRIERLRLA